MESRSALLYKGSHLDERVERDMPMTNEDMRRRLGVAQVEALFDFIPVAALAAAAAAATLTAGLVSLGSVVPWIGAVWVCYIVACALGNLSLLAVPLSILPVTIRARPSMARLGAPIRRNQFSAMGIGFGWAPMGLTIESRLDFEFLTRMVSLCVADAAVTAFGPYLAGVRPFLSFRDRSVHPSELLFSGTLHLYRVSPFLMLIFITSEYRRARRPGEPGVSSGSVRLQVRTEELADDLERQRDIGRERQPRQVEIFLAAASHDLRQPVHAACSVSSSALCAGSQCRPRRGCWSTEIARRRSTPSTVSSARF